MYKIIIITFKCIHGLAPAYLSELVTFHLPSRPLRSQDLALLHNPRTHKKYCGDRSFAKAAPTLWNRSPGSLRNTDKLDKFKRDLKTFLFRSAYHWQFMLTFWRLWVDTWYLDIWRFINSLSLYLEDQDSLRLRRHCIWNEALKVHPSN